MAATKQYRVLVGKRGEHSFKRAGTWPDSGQGAVWAAGGFLKANMDIEGGTPILLLRGKEAFLFSAGDITTSRLGPLNLNLPPQAAAKGDQSDAG